jgi:tetratricopeptide (TPR) repeat protein
MIPFHAAHRTRLLLSSLWVRSASQRVVWATCSAVLVASASYGAGASLRADLSLGEIQPASPPNAIADAEAAGLAHFAAAQLLDASGHMRAALGHYTAATQTFPAKPDLAERTAAMTLRYDDRASALKVLESCVKAAPQSPEACINLARFLVTYPDPDQAKDADPAMAVLTAGLARLPREIDLYNEAVMQRLTLDRRGEAEQLLVQASRQTVGEPDYWLKASRIAQQVWPLAHPEKRQQHLVKVNEFIEKARKLAGTDREDVRLAVSQYYVMSNQLDRATEVTEEAIKIHQSLPAMRLLIPLYQRQERQAEVLKLLEAILKTEPDDIESRRLITNLYVQSNQAELAQQHAERLIQTAGGNADDYVALGEMFRRNKRVDKALQLNQRALALYPTQVRLLLQAALIHSSLKREKEALIYMESAESTAKTNNPEILTDDFYQTWANMLQGLEQFDEATKRYQQAIDLVPASEPTRAAAILNNVGYMWLEQRKRLDEAGQFIIKANKLEPKNPVYIDSLGWYYYLKADYNKALEVFADAEALMTKPSAEDAEILVHIGQTWRKLGETAKAKQYFDRAQTLAPNDPKLRDAVR